MTEREWATPSRPLRMLAVASLALVVGCFVLVAVMHLSGLDPDLEGLTVGIAFLALSTVGTLIVLRRGDPVGWL